jgi:hypothetical protein
LVSERDKSKAKEILELLLYLDFQFQRKDDELLKAIQNAHGYPENKGITFGNGDDVFRYLLQAIQTVKNVFRFPKPQTLWTYYSSGHLVGKQQLEKFNSLHPYRIHDAVWTFENDDEGKRQKIVYLSLRNDNKDHFLSETKWWKKAKEEEAEMLQRQPREPNISSYWNFLNYFHQHVKKERQKRKLSEYALDLLERILKQSDDPYIRRLVPLEDLNYLVFVEKGDFKSGRKHVDAFIMNPHPFDDTIMRFCFVRAEALLIELTAEEILTVIQRGRQIQKIPKQFLHYLPRHIYIPDREIDRNTRVYQWLQNEWNRTAPHVDLDGDQVKFTFHLPKEFKQLCTNNPSYRCEENADILASLQLGLYGKKLKQQPLSIETRQFLRKFKTWKVTVYDWDAENNQYHLKQKQSVKGDEQMPSDIQREFEKQVIQKAKYNKPNQRRYLLQIDEWTRGNRNPWIQFYEYQWNEEKTEMTVLKDEDGDDFRIMRSTEFFRNVPDTIVDPDERSLDAVNREFPHPDG